MDCIARYPHPICYVHSGPAGGLGTRSRALKPNLEFETVWHA